MGSHKRALGQLAGRSELQSIIQAFPKVVHAFGYGSGVFQQQTSDQKAAPPGMVDIIMVAENAHNFHEENLQKHPSHYSMLCRIGGPSFCASVQRQFGARVFFHALIPFHNFTIKYGIVQTNDLLEDLREWKYMYLAGRLHKPTVVIEHDDSLADNILEYQYKYNLPYALSTALLLQSQGHSTMVTLSLPSLYERISHLSYAGDPRMHVGGEDPHKVHKLVHSPGQVERFHQLYRAPLEELKRAGLINLDDDNVEWSPTESREALRQRLPPRLQDATNLEASLRDIVAPAARGQSIKGVVTAGLFNSARYAVAKFSKGILKPILG